MNLAGRAITEYDLKLLRVFKSVVENGGFAAAENELGITRSTISVHMANLEARMGLSLCQRGRGGFALTPDGQNVYQAFLRLFDALGDFSSAVSQLSQAIEGELIILHSDVLDPIRSQLLAEVISLIKQAAPGIVISLDGDRIENIERALSSDKAHIGIFPDYRKMAGLVYSQAFSEQIYLCCSERHPLFSTNAVCDDSMITQYPAVIPGVEISQSGRKQLKKLSPGAVAYQFDSRKALIASGEYIGYLPESFIQHEVNQGTFKILNKQRYQYSFEQAIVHKVAPSEPKKIALFIEKLNQCITRYPQLSFSQ